MTEETKQIVRENTSFKISPNKFLVEYWNDNLLVDFIGKKYCMSTGVIHVANIKLSLTLMLLCYQQIQIV